MVTKADLRMRNHDQEFQDNAERKYAYGFDDVVRRYMMRTLSPFFREGPALEVGCFEGTSTRLLADVFHDLTVVEASRDLIARAQANVPDRVRFVHGLVQEAKLQPVYRSIFLVHTLEHIDPPQPALEALRDALAPDGLFFCVVPNAQAASRQIAVKMGLISHNAAVTPAEHAHGHRCTYTMDTLERDLRETGFEVVSRGGIMFKPLANFQFDKAIETGLVSPEYLEGCYALGMQYPELCSSIYAVCRRRGA